MLHTASPLSWIVNKSYGHFVVGCGQQAFIHTRIKNLKQALFTHINGMIIDVFTICTCDKVAAVYSRRMVTDWGLFHDAYRTSFIIKMLYYSSLEHSLPFLRNLIGQFRGTKSLSCP